MAYSVICAFSIAFFDGTGDNGDSIMHYLFARYAPAHPVLYFDHWAKPLFVLLASPFAQFGFVGMKVFNALCGLFTIYFSYRCALLLRFNNALLVPVFMLFSPLNYILTFSGLTEPLFAVMLVSGLFLCIKQQGLLAALLISFLPYVRSEGLIILGVFALYFIYKKQWRSLPFLISGSVVYAFAGYFVYHNLLWVFTNIPYNTLSSIYGRGGLDHFVVELVNVLGVPLYAFFWLGLIAMIYFTFKNRNSPEEKILILGGFLCFFVAHTLFWYLGIFNSMGLKRVFIAIIPIMGLISLSGFNFITNFIFVSHSKIKISAQILLLFYVLVFPFTPNPSAVQWNRDMSLEKDQLLAHQTTDYILKHKKPGSKLIFNHPYFSLTFELDYFDPIQAPKLSLETIDQMRSGDFILWDNHFSEQESLMKVNDLYKLDCLIPLKTFTTFSHGKTVEFKLFEKTERSCLN